VQCNPEPALLKLLAALGAGFDCASKAELEAVAQMGVPKGERGRQCIMLSSVPVVLKCISKVAYAEG
jgi:diaminopimelate decarboxylase